MTNHRSDAGFGLTLGVVPSLASELHWIPDGSHFGFWLNDDAEAHQQYVLDWLLAHVNTG